MRVFISWSGTTSHKVALALRDWLPSVLQVIDPYVSSADIDKGARWLSDVGRNLDNTGFGILCVTPDNLNAPWLNFEAGALAKSFDSARVTPFLVGMSAGDLTGPISQFQATLATEDDLNALIRSINRAAGSPVSEERIGTIIGMWWPQLKESLDAIAASEGVTAQEPPRRDLNEMVGELLVLTRAMSRNFVNDEINEQEGTRKAFHAELFSFVSALEPPGTMLTTSGNRDDLHVRTDVELSAADEARLHDLGKRHGCRITLGPTLGIDADFERSEISSDRVVGS